MKYRLCWKSKLTGETGHGEFLDGLDLARDWRDYANREFPDVTHWIEDESGRVVK